MNTENKKEFDIVKVREQVVANVTKMIESKMLTAPANYKEEVFFTFQKLAELKDIDKCEVKNICNELAKIFRNDLAVTKNHCALMVINSKHSPTGKALSMRWQYQGMLYVAKTKCNVKRATPVLVFESDEFSAYYNAGILEVNHIPRFSDGDKLRGGYCVIEFHDGTKETKFYTKSELDKRREKAQKQAIWENNKIVGYQESNFWQDWEREMYEKTLINSTLKRVIETTGITVEAGGDARQEPVDVAYEEASDTKLISFAETPAELPAAQTKPDF